MRMKEDEDENGQGNLCWDMSNGSAIREKERKRENLTYDSRRLSEYNLGEIEHAELRAALSRNKSRIYLVSKMSIARVNVFRFDGMTQIRPLQTRSPNEEETTHSKTLTFLIFYFLWVCVRSLCL
jgi:hypothetical protein